MNGPRLAEKNARYENGLGRIPEPLVRERREALMESLSGGQIALETLER